MGLSCMWRKSNFLLLGPNIAGKLFMHVEMWERHKSFGPKSMTTRDELIDFFLEKHAKIGTLYVLGMLLIFRWIQVNSAIICPFFPANGPKMKQFSEPKYSQKIAHACRDVRETQKFWTKALSKRQFDGICVELWPSKCHETRPSSYFSVCFYPPATFA